MTGRSSGVISAFFESGGIRRDDKSMNLWLYVQVRGKGVKKGNRIRVESKDRGRIRGVPNDLRKSPVKIN